jgi:hypothetical protein
MAGDLGRDLGVRRVGEVVPEAKLHLLPPARGADHHEAQRRMEAQQVRHHGQHAVR